jgi:cell wall-associated NlpC family hydrolase
MWQPKGKTKGRHVEYDYAGNAVVRPVQRGQAMEIALDGIVFRLIKVSRGSGDVTLTFEDRTVYWLRHKRGARHVSRAKVTRAQFILSLVREVKADRTRFVCPELNIRQPIDSGKARKTTQTKPSKSSRRGLATGTLTVKGRRATPDQLRIGQRALAVADQLGASPKATVALMAACIVESGVQNLTHGDGSSVGVLQLLSMHGSVQRRLDVEWCVKLFLTQGFTGRGGAVTLAKRNPSMSAGDIAATVQGPAAQYRGRYGQVATEAQAWVDSYGGSGGSVPEADASGGGTRYRSYQFTREADEDSWTAIQRLADEVGWRCFVQGRSIFYLSEQDLYRRDPQYTITNDDPAILELDFDVDWGKPVSECTLSVVAGRWTCPPGDTVLIEGYGPPDGRWLCTSWQRDYFSPVASITLKQPGKEKLEPQAEQAAQKSSSSDTGELVTDDGVDRTSAVGRAYARADAIDKQNRGYVWGGGHGSFNDSRGYDCSGFVSSCLNAAGLLSGSPQATGGLVSWGQPGRGKHMTVWVKENGIPHQSHTFIIFNLKGTDRYAEAGGGNSAHTGWHSPRSTAGFVPRHWPGT